MEKDYLPINPTPMTKEEAMQKNANVLAFIGDAVQTLYVRNKVMDRIGGKAGSLHREVAKEICASSQASASRLIFDGLNEEEESIYKRCRNSNKPSRAKNADVIEYNIASGFEGLIGFLYLTGQHERLNELLEQAYTEK